MLKPFLALCLVAVATCYVVNPGPLVTATRGEVWPKPQRQKTFEDYFVIKPNNFSFSLQGSVLCPNLLNEAFRRYWTLIANTATYQASHANTRAASGNFLGYLDHLNVDIPGRCGDEGVRPSLDENEGYTLDVTADENILIAPTVWGVLRGLETFSQMVYRVDDELRLNATVITDFPRFAHRGLLLDTSRHYLPLSIILETLDAMAYNKLNVFHWHLTDDQSFPYQSRTFPELSNQGAYHPVSKIYDQLDIQRVIEYARLRGIRVIPEFDTPGHTRSWGVAYPDILTTCYSGQTPNGNLGPMDPTKDETYEFITQLFTEVVEVFPDSYFHIGGDEVDYDCWESNPFITIFMQDNNITDYSQLESFFIQKVVDLLNDLNSEYIVWEEVFVNGVELPNSTVVQVWRDNGFATLSQVTGFGKFALYSSCWYLDHLESGGDWQKFYYCDPGDFSGTVEQQSRLIGGEACMWTEAANEYNIASRIWPRASATAERLWSAADVNSVEEAKARLEEHTCRMNNRGISAQPPNGPGVCF